MAHLARQREPTAHSIVHGREQAVHVHRHGQAAAACQAVRMCQGHGHAEAVSTSRARSVLQHRRATAERKGRLQRQKNGLLCCETTVRPTSAGALCTDINDLGPRLLQVGQTPQLWYARSRYEDAAQLCREAVRCHLLQEVLPQRSIVDFIVQAQFCHEDHCTRVVAEVFPQAADLEHRKTKQEYAKVSHKAHPLAHMKKAYDRSVQTLTMKHMHSLTQMGQRVTPETPTSPWPSPSAYQGTLVALGELFWRRLLAQLLQLGRVQQADKVFTQLFQALVGHTVGISTRSVRKENQALLEAPSSAL